MALVIPTSTHPFLNPYLSCQYCHSKQRLCQPQLKWKFRHSNRSHKVDDAIMKKIYTPFIFALTLFLEELRTTGSATGVIRGSLAWLFPTTNYKPAFNIEHLTIFFQRVINTYVITEQLVQNFFSVTIFTLYWSGKWSRWRGSIAVTSASATSTSPTSQPNQRLR